MHIGPGHVVVPAAVPDVRPILHVFKSLALKDPKGVPAPGLPSRDQGKVRQGLLPPEHSGFAERLAKLEIDQLTVDSQSLASIARSLGSFPVVLEENDNTIARLRNRLPGMLARLQIIESKDEYEQFIRDVSLELAKTAIAEATGKRDLYAIQTVRCIEDLDKTLNLLSVRIREWYGLHFPELDRLVEKHARQ